MENGREIERVIEIIQRSVLKLTAKDGAEWDSLLYV